MKYTVRTGIKISVTLVSDKRIIDIRSATIKLKHGRRAGPDTAMLGITDFSRIVLVGDGLVTIYSYFSYVCFVFQTGSCPGMSGNKTQIRLRGLERRVKITL